MKRISLTLLALIVAQVAFAGHQLLVDNDLRTQMVTFLNDEFAVAANPEDTDHYGEYQGDSNFLFAYKRLLAGVPPNNLAYYPQGVFIVVSLQIGNKTMKDVELSRSMFQVVSEDGRTFQIADAQKYFNSIGKGFPKTIRAKSVNAGRIVFDLPMPLPSGARLKVTGPDGKVEYIKFHFHKEGDSNETKN